MCCKNLYHFFTNFTWRVWGSKGCQWVHWQKTLLLSTTVNTVTTVTQTHLKLQEIHPKFLWARQWPLPPSKSVRSHFFWPPSNPWFRILVLPPPCGNPDISTINIFSYLSSKFLLLLLHFPIIISGWHSVMAVFKVLPFKSPYIELFANNLRSWCSRFP